MFACMCLCVHQYPGQTGSVSIIGTDGLIHFLLVCTVYVHSSSVKQALPKHGAIFKMFLLFCHHLSVCEVISKILVIVCTCEYSLHFSVLTWEDRKKKLLSDKQ